MADLIAGIKQYFDLGEMVRQYVAVARKHPTGFVALCPFHVENTASMVVHTRGRREGQWMCFGCQAHGDVIDFYARMEGLAKGKAIGALARQAGIEDGQRGKTISPDQFLYMQDLRRQSAWWWRKRHTSAVEALEAATARYFAGPDDGGLYEMTFCGARVRYIAALRPIDRWHMFNALRTGTDLTQWKTEVETERMFAEAWMSLARITEAA